MEQQFNNQDWTPVVIKKKVKKQPIQIDPDFKNIKKLDEHEDGGEFNKISENDRRNIITLRSQKKIKQETLAMKLNIKKEIIRDIENGSHLENKQLYARIIKYLNSIPTPPKN